MGIEAYAPTTDHSTEKIEWFYELLEELAESQEGMLIVQVDWNVKVGPDSYQQWLEELAGSA